MSEKIFPGTNLLDWANAKKMSKTTLAEQIGVSRQQLYVYFDSSNLSKKLVDNIVQKLGVPVSEIWPDENISAFHEGRPVYGVKRGVDRFVELNNGMMAMITPLIEEDAQAGFMSGFCDKTFLEDLPNHAIVVNRFHKGNYFSFRVKGESMTNGSIESIPEGSIVTAREIKKELWNSRFHIHNFRDYVIVHKEGLVVKRIIDHNVEQGTITCSSLNPDKKSYPDYDLNLDECNMILNIVNVSASR